LEIGRVRLLICALSLAPDLVLRSLADGHPSPIWKMVTRESLSPTRIARLQETQSRPTDLLPVTCKPLAKSRPADRVVARARSAVYISFCPAFHIGTLEHRSGWKSPWIRSR
jgi:hypothetical protein